MKIHQGIRTLGRFTVIALFLSVASSKVTAQTEFDTSYQVTYQAQETGETFVTQEISLTNKTKNRYASEYRLTIGSPRLINIAAYDERGELETKVESNDTGTNIYVKFNRQVVGLGKTYSWTLTYTSLDTTVKNGMVWEINIPRLSPQTEITKYEVRLIVPKSWYPLMYMSPRPIKSEVTENEHVYVFTKEQIQSGGASAAFGKYQLFALTLKYHLKNPKTIQGITTIALPPDIIGRQEILFESLEPKPIKVYQDSDGNYLADYKISGGEQINPVFRGFVKIFNPVIDPKRGGPLAKLPSKLVEQYTRPQPFWEVADPQIQAQAKALIDRNKTVSENARLIYNFIVGRLAYDKNARRSYAERVGAAKTLAEPTNAICMGYTDLFIALARAVGIPARELNGYAYTADNVLRPLSIEFRGNDVLHSWPEFYDPYLGWVAVDPTWGSTTNGLDYFSKLDTNHIVFSIKGLSSEGPLPAGSYKISDEDGDVTVGFANPQDIRGDHTENLEVTFNLRKNNIAGLPFSGIIKVRNNGKKTAFGVKTRLGGKNLKTVLGKETSLGNLLPLEEKEFKFTLQTPNFNARLDENIKLELAYQNFDGEVQTKDFTHPVAIYPFFQLPLSVYHLVAGVLLILIVAAVLLMSRNRHVHALLSKNPVRSVRH